MTTNHDCNVNHESNSGLMESILCLKRLGDLHHEANDIILVGGVVSEHGSTLSYHCCAKIKQRKIDE